jgi:hypothetical protein
MGKEGAAAVHEGSKEEQLGRFGFSSTPKLRALLSAAVQHPLASQVGTRALAGATRRISARNIVLQVVCYKRLHQLEACCDLLAGTQGTVSATLEC